MAATLSATSANLNNGCMLTNKAITVELDGFEDELTEGGPWQIEVTITNLSDDSTLFGPTTVLNDIATNDVDDQGYAFSIDLPGSYRISVRVYLLDVDESVLQEVTATLDFNLCLRLPSSKTIATDIICGVQAVIRNLPVILVYAVVIKNMSGSYEADFTWNTSQYNQLQFSSSRR
jgi:hypothetical protein